GRPGAHHLESHGAVEGVLPGQVNDAHASSAQLALDSEAWDRWKQLAGRIRLATQSNGGYGRGHGFPARGGGSCGGVNPANPSVRQKNHVEHENVWIVSTNLSQMNAFREHGFDV